MAQTVPTDFTDHDECTTTIAANATDAETRLAASESHAASTSNPHSVTKTQVGLGNCDNTSDVNKQLREYFPTIANNVTDATNDIDVGTGRVWVSNGTDEKLVSTSVTIKRLDASWAVGTNQGGLDTGTKANSTWYYIWLIHRSDTGVTDLLFSTSATSPTMPTSYDYKRRLRCGAILTDGSGNIRAFSHWRNRILWGTAIVDFNASTRAASALTVSVPPISDIVWEGWIQIQGNAGESADVRSLSATNAIYCIARVQVSAQFASDAGAGVATESGQISLGSTASTSCSLRTNGFIDIGGG